MTPPCPPGPGLSRALLVSAGALLAGLLLAALVILVVTLGWAASEPQPTRVFVALPERVPDGDTVVYPAGACRLLGVDAPERKKGSQPGQRMAEDAFKALRDELMRGPNTVLVYGVDRYSRNLCIVIDESGYIVNLWLVESGFAEAYLLERSPFASGLKSAEERAKKDKRGIWGLPKYESPSAYRLRLKTQ